MYNVFNKFLTKMSIDNTYHEEIKNIHLILKLFSKFSLVYSPFAISGSSVCDILSFFTSVIRKKVIHKLPNRHFRWRIQCRGGFRMSRRALVMYDNLYFRRNRGFRADDIRSRLIHTHNRVGSINWRIFGIDKCYVLKMNISFHNKYAAGVIWRAL